MAGVEQRADKVLIRFEWKGKPKYQTTEYKPTPAGLKKAQKLRDQIVREIKAGTFSYKEYFPDSKEAEQDISTFFDMAKKYVAVCQSDGIAPSTLSGYKKMINNYWLPFLGTNVASKITTGDIRDVIINNGLGRLSRKTQNNALTPLRGIFNLAIEYRLIRKNPCDPIKWKKVQKPTPDPLTPKEMKLVIKSVEPEWRNYFMVAFGTGMRTSEIIELRWKDIDFRLKLIEVSRAYVNQKVGPTKTGVTRLVEITKTASPALQKPDGAKPTDLIFLKDGKQINNDKPPRVAWDNALESAGIRHRKAYSTRHTWASIMLSKGASPYIVSQQMGNSVEMVMRHYAKWIQSANTSLSELL